nr:hypothetical protein [Roseomonas rosea]
MGVEEVHKLGEVGQRAGEAVDFVENDQVGLAGADVSRELLQRRALEGAARETAIVVAGGERDPAFVTLAPDEGLAGVALGIEGVEGLLQPILGGLAGVDGAATTGGVRG